MELLATIFRITHTYAPTAKIIADLMHKTESHNIVVLGAGSGGGILDVIAHLPKETRVTLTDIFPDQDFKSKDSRIRYEQTPIDATNVPANLKGIRVMYTAFHHFAPEAALALLKNAVESRQPIAIFESTERSLLGLFVIALLPLIVFALTPFTRPFRLSRFLWTYIIPIAPVFVVWDGFVSAMRTYNAKDLAPVLAIFAEYEWTFERLRGPNFEPLSAFTGRPRN